MKYSHEDYDRAIRRALENARKAREDAFWARYDAAIKRALARFDDDEEGERGGRKGGHGNTRLPFGLCKRFGIKLGKGATPHDAWEALAGKGVTPEAVYAELKKSGKVGAGKGSEPGGGSAMDKVVQGTREGKVEDADLSKRIENAADKRKRLEEKVATLKKQMDEVLEPVSKELEDWEKNNSGTVQDYRKWAELRDKAKEIGLPFRKEIESLNGQLGYGENRGVSDFARKSSEAKRNFLKGFKVPRCKAQSMGEVKSYCEKTLGLSSHFPDDYDVDMANDFMNSIAEGYENAPRTMESMKSCGDYSVMRNEWVGKAKPYVEEAVRKKYPSESEDEIQKWTDYWLDKFELDKGGLYACYHYGRVDFGSIKTAMGDDKYAELQKINEEYRGVYSMKIMKAGKEMTVENMKFDIKRRFHPNGTGSVKAVFDHEMGHAIDHAYNISRSLDIENYWGNLYFDDVKKGLSEYATQDIKEFVAEAWSEYKNNPRAREMCKTVGWLMEMQIKDEEQYLD